MVITQLGYLPFLVLIHMNYDRCGQIRSANNPGKPLYDEWLEYFPDNKDPGRPGLVQCMRGHVYDELCNF
jgi:hypothetical protein